VQNTIDLNFVERLCTALDYDQRTGVFRWRITKGRCRKGAVAGKICSNGYRYIGFEGEQWLAHRLAWIYCTGQLPVDQLDHIDRNRDNNAFANIRQASKTLNGGNSGIWRTNTSGCRGVSWDKSRARWGAYIWRRNRKFHLGYFDHLEDAGRAYDRAAEDYFGEFATLNLPKAA
jgi:DNA-dependent RNA polymerase auxiliary subunit epsilon